MRQNGKKQNGIKPLKRNNLQRKGKKAGIMTAERGSDAATGLLGALASI